MKRTKYARNLHRKSIEKKTLDLEERLTQTERTLDEAYYPSLDEKALKVRNNDQVVSRECESLLGASQLCNDSEKPILMVPQIWIWKCKNYIISAQSSSPKTPWIMPTRVESRWFPKRDAEHWKKDHMGYSISVLDHGDLFIGLLLAHHVDQFGQPQAGQFQSPLDYFEIGVVRAISDVEKYMASTTSANLDIKKEWTFMHRISDIRSELAMIQTILDDQNGIMESLIQKLDQGAKSHEKWPTVQAAVQNIEAYTKRVRKIDRDAERMERKIQDQLNLKRNYASIRDARTSLLLGTSVMGFTIITIIFTPLSFITGLLGLDIDRIADHKFTKGNETVYPTNYVGTWFGKQSPLTQRDNAPIHVLT